MNLPLATLVVYLFPVDIINTNLVERNHLTYSYLWIYNKTEFSRICYQGTVKDRDEWHHLAGSYSDDKGKWTEFHIGKPNNVANYYMHGVIDEVAIFNVALTQADINTIMTRGLEVALSVSPVNYRIFVK